MASNSRRTSRRNSALGPVDGNLARKYERREADSRELERRLDHSGRMDFDQLYERRPETAAERNARRRAQLKASIRPAQRVSFLAMLGFACVGALMVVLLLCYVQLNSISRSIVAMKSEISRLQVEQIALLTQYEQTFDLSAVKEAAEAAGMTQPSDGQIYYISLPGEDRARVHQPESRGLERFFTAWSQGILDRGQ
ncbi:MAG: hypothetical protein K2O45_14985 [Oscillospiraceae bacterium]|nr:hypothetical protein [Oscillospiraceae bacterium]